MPHCKHHRQQKRQSGIPLAKCDLQRDRKTRHRVHTRDAQTDQQERSIHPGHGKRK
jgi:hypothetical protein